MGTLYQEALRRGIRYILSGDNFATEAVLPRRWTYGVHDWRYIKQIHRRFAGTPLSKFPHVSHLRFDYLSKVRRIRVVGLLDYLPYVKSDAMELLQRELGWRPYGGKHYESIYTRFFQGFILPVKFGIDKRKAHLSTLICAGQLTREEALRSLDENEYLTGGQAAEDRVYAVKKLGLTEVEFDEIMRAPAKTYEDYRSLVARYVAPRIGRMSLQAVRPVTLSALYQTLLKEGGKDGRPLSARTVSYVHAVLRKAFNDAVHTDQLIASNPAATAKRPRTTAIHVVKDVWDGPQLVRFLDAVATHRLYPLFHLAAYTGARRGELLYLRWDDVHLDGHDPFVRIRGSATIVAGHRVEGTTKSGRVRTVGLDAGTVSTLRAHAERQAKEREFVDQSWHETGHVFRMEIGTPLSPDIGGVVMRQTVRDLNDVDGAALLPAMRFHDLRHIHATLLLKGGVPVHVVAARLGHADPAITLRVYAHVLRDQASEVAQTFAEQVRPVSRPVSKTAEMEKHCDCS
jgi:integrase